MSDSVPNIVFV